eukprot:gene9214-16891_t
MQYTKRSPVLFGFLLVVFFTQESIGYCPKGSIDNFAFCCCKKIYIIEPSSSFSPILVSATIASENSSTSSFEVSSYAPASTSSINPSPSASVTSMNFSISPNTSSSVATVLPTPTPIYRGDACFYTDVKFGYYNECYCNETRYDYVGFNNSNGYYTKDVNATDFDYKCWNLPKPKLYIAGMFQSAEELGKKLLVAADMAIEEINKNDAVLPGYEVVMLRQNSTNHEISTGSAVLLDYLAQSPKKIAIIGPDDDDLAKTVAAISSLPRYKILQISYGTSAIDLSTNHESFYRYFFRTKPFLDLLYNAARVEMLKKYSWGKIGLIYSNDDYYKKLNANLRTQMQEAKISISTEEDFVTDPWTTMKHLKERDIHVVLGSFSGDAASRVLCAAYKLKMYGPLYVYLFIGYTSLRGIDGCTLDQVRCAARYQFFFNYEPITCQHHFVANYTIRLNETFFNTSTNPVASSDQLEAAKYTYDAVNAIASVLHNVDPDKSNSSRFYLNYAYGSRDYGEKFRSEILTYDKCGASNNVSFGDDGNRYFKIKIVQILFGGGDKTVGWYDVKRTPKLEMPHVQWPGNHQPYREISSSLNWRYISKGLYIAYCIFAAFGILFAIFCLVVLIWRRKHKEIRYSFYLLNIIIIIGCILVYISVFLFGVDNVISPKLTVDEVCRARLWVFSIGFVLVVGGLIAKLWIAQDVLSRRLLLEKRRRRKIMFAIIFVIFVVNLILLLCWHYIDPLKRVIEYIKNEVNYPCDVDIWPDNPFTVKITAVEQCKCSNDIIWYFIMCIWKAALVIIAVYWAYQTRQVFIPTINDTQRCGTCAYVIAACTVIGFIIAMTTRLLPDVFFGLVGFIIIVCVTAVLIILFLHKSRVIYEMQVLGYEIRRENTFKAAIPPVAEFLFSFHSKSELTAIQVLSTLIRVNGACLNAIALAQCVVVVRDVAREIARSVTCVWRKRNGTEKAGEQKFIVKGIGDDKSAELARLQRELEMKNKYIEQLKRTDFPEVRPIWTQTTEPVILLSDTCDDDTDTDDNSNGDDKGKGGKRKKKRKLKIFSNKLDFSHVKSKTDSNYKTGTAPGPGKGTGKSNQPGANDKDGGYSVLYVNADDSGNKEEIAKLNKILAERDAEIDRLKYGTGKKSEFETIDIDGSKEKEAMKKDLEKDEKQGSQKKPSEDDLDKLLNELDTEETPRGIYDGNKGKSKIFGQKLDWSQIPSKLRSAGMISHDAAASKGTTPVKSPPKTSKVSPSTNNSSGNLSNSSSLDTQSSSNQGAYQKRTPNFKIFNERIDYSNIRSKIRPMLSNDPSRNCSSSNDNGSVRVLNAPVDYGKKQRNPSTQSVGSLNKVDKPKDTQINSKSPGISEGPNEINVTFPSGQLTTPSDKSTNKSTKPSESVFDGAAKEPASEGIQSQGFNVKLTLDLKTESGPAVSEPEKMKSDVKIVNDPKDYSHVKSNLTSDQSPKPNPKPSVDSRQFEKPISDVKISNDPKDYSQVKSKLITEPPVKPNPAPSMEASQLEKPNTDVKILNDPKDYSHVKSKLIADPPAKPSPAPSMEASQLEKPNTDVKILNDPKDYSQVKSKLIADPPAKPSPGPSVDVSPREKPSTNVKILNDPKDYTHVKSKLISDPPSKPNQGPSVEVSPRDKPSTNVKIVNDPKNYNHVKSKLIPDPPSKPNPDSTVASSPREKPNTNVKIVNDPKNYGHVKSKLIPDPPPKPNADKSMDASPRDKPTSNVKILNDPKNYSHVRSKLSVMGPPPDMKKSNVKIVNKPADYSHVKSKLP